MFHHVNIFSYKLVCPKCRHPKTVMYIVLVNFIFLLNISFFFFFGVLFIIVGVQGDGLSNFLEGWLGGGFTQ